MVNKNEIKPGHRMTFLANMFILLFSFAWLNAGAQTTTDTVLIIHPDSLTTSPDTLVITSDPQNITPNSSFMKGYANSYITDTKSLFINPFQLNAVQVIAAAVVTTGTVALIAWGDKPIQQFFNRNQSVFISKSSYYFFSPLGSGLISIPAMGVFFGCGVIWKNKKAKETGLKGLEAFVVTAVLTNVIKQVAHRHRPYQDTPADPHAWEGPFNYGGPYGTFGYNSFPSGHSSAIFAVATVVGLEYWDTKWVPCVSFGIAGFTALYRLAVNDHWASDVLFGSALGFAIGSMVYFNANKKIQIIPVSSTGFGATLVYHF